MGIAIRSQRPMFMFMDATRRYMTPLKVRGDRGGENVLVADEIIIHCMIYMLQR